MSLGIIMYFAINDIINSSNSNNYVQLTKYSKLDRYFFTICGHIAGLLHIGENWPQYIYILQLHVLSSTLLSVEDNVPYIIRPWKYEFSTVTVLAKTLYALKIHISSLKLNTYKVMCVFRVY